MEQYDHLQPVGECLNIELGHLVLHPPAPRIRPHHALHLEQKLLPVVQRHRVPAGARVERQHPRALAVVLGLGDEPLHDHARAGGQRTRRAGGGRGDIGNLQSMLLVAPARAEEAVAVAVAAAVVVAVV